MSEEFPFSIPFIRWAAVSLITPDRPVLPRRIYDHEFIYVLAGHGYIVIEGKSHRIAPDNLFMVLPRQWHSYHADPGSALDLLGVHFDWVSQHDSLKFSVFLPADDPIDEALFREPRQVPNWDINIHAVLDLKGRPRVRRVLEETVAEFDRDETPSHGVAGALLAAAIHLIATEAPRALQMQHSRHSSLGADALRRARKARELLESITYPPLTIEDVARQVDWSADHLRRVFREALGVSPYHVQTSARLSHAKLLMRTENISITEVAARCGFDDASHFSRVFKKESGFTPRQFLILVKRL